MEVSQEVREAVLERDGHQCVRCGSPGPRLAMHHRRYVFGRSRNRDNSPDNLETLCMSCHGKLHHAHLRENPITFRCKDCRRLRESPCHLGIIKCRCGGFMSRIERTANVVRGHAVEN